MERKWFLQKINGQTNRSMYRGSVEVMVINSKGALLIKMLN